MTLRHTIPRLEESQECNLGCLFYEGRLDIRVLSPVRPPTESATGTGVPTPSSRTVWSSRNPRVTNTLVRPLRLFCTGLLRLLETHRSGKWSRSTDWDWTPEREETFPLIFKKGRRSVPDLNQSNARRGVYMIHEIYVTRGGEVDVRVRCLLRRPRVSLTQRTGPSVSIIRYYWPKFESQVRNRQDLTTS